MSAPSPQTFGAYRVVSTLARGGMAEILVARKDGPAGFSKNVVIKRVLPQHAGNDEFLRMFRDEARLAAQLEHPNIVSVMDFGEVQGSCFLAMEYLQGIDLATALKTARRALPVNVVAALASHACAGLHYAHTFADESGKPLRVVHRDVSPSNLFLTRQGVLKVLDFGIAKAEGKLTQTRAGIIKGKLLYMSPEQTWSKVLDARSDLWSLGVVMYELACGVQPFFRGSEEDHTLLNERATMVAIDSEPPQPLRSHVAQVPEAFERLVLKCLEKDPERRWQSAAELRRALDDFLRPVGSAAEIISQFAEETFAPQASVVVDEVPGTEVTVAPTRETPLTDAQAAIHTVLRPAVPAPQEELELASLRSPRRGLVAVIAVLLVVAAGAFVLTPPGAAETPAPPKPVKRASPPPAPVVVVEPPAVVEPEPSASEPEPEPIPLQPTKSKQKAVTRTVTPPPPPPVVSAATGSLKLTCAPYGEVTVDGDARGRASPESPLFLTLPSGKHVVVCRHPELGSSKSTVTVGDGETVTKRLDY